MRKNGDSGRLRGQVDLTAAKPIVRILDRSALHSRSHATPFVLRRGCHDNDAIDGPHLEIRSHMHDDSITRPFLSLTEYLDTPRPHTAIHNHGEYASS